MSPADSKLPTTPIKLSTHRSILGPGGNTLSPSDNKASRGKRLVVTPGKKNAYKPNIVEETAKLSKEALEKASRSSNFETTEVASVESLCTSDRSSVISSPAKRTPNSGMKVKSNGIRPQTYVKEKHLFKDPGSVKRCHWITPHSDQLYVNFHDKEWGVPVHDDKKLFELLVFSQALAELSWPSILHKRDTFRQHFDDFDAASISKFTNAKLLSLESFLSKPKVEAVVENATQIVKVQREFGSFSNYCWNFINHKPIKNHIKYANQVPAKSPKSLLISKDMMQRGFLSVGPTVIYSFMEAAGMVNDHLLSCFRYEECTAKSAKIHALENVET